MPKLGYTQQTLGIPSLNRSEVTTTTRAKYTNQSVLKQNLYPNKWDQLGKTLQSASQLAINSFRAVTSFDNYNTTEIKNKNKIDDAYVAASTNIGASKLTTLYTDEALLKSTGEYDPAKSLDNYAQTRDSLVKNINNNKHMSDKAKSKAILNIDKMFSGQISSRANEVYKKITTENINKLNQTILNTTTQQFSSNDVTLSDIITSNKANINSLKDNGVNTDIFEQLTPTISMYKDNKEVIYKRYNEAVDYLQQIEEGKKNRPEGFAKYLNTLTMYKNNLDREEASNNINKNSAIKQSANRSLEYIMIKGAITTSNTNVKGIADKVVQEAADKGIYSKLFTMDNYNSLYNLTRENVIKTTKDLAKQAGYSPKKYDAYVNKLTDKVLFKQFSLHLKNSIGSDVPIDTYPKEWRPMAEEDLKQDINKALNNKLFDTINESFVTNPKVVKKTVQDSMTRDFYHLMGTVTKDNFKELQQQFNDKYGSIDKVISFSGLDSKVKSQITLFMHGASYENTIINVDNIHKEDTTSLKINGTADALKALKKLPFSLQKDASEYFKLTTNNGGGYLTKDALNSYVESHTLTTGVYGFRDKVYFDNEVNDLVPNEQTKKDAITTFEQKLNIKNIGDGSSFEKVPGGIALISKDGITIATMNDKDFVSNLRKIFNKRLANTLRQKQWDKLEEDAAWDEQGFDLGRGDFVIKDGKYIYKRDFMRGYEDE